MYKLEKLNKEEGKFLKIIQDEVQINVSYVNEEELKKTLKYKTKGIEDLILTSYIEEYIQKRLESNKEIIIEGIIENIIKTEYKIIDYLNGKNNSFGDKFKDILPKENPKISVEIQKSFKLKGFQGNIDTTFIKVEIEGKELKYYFNNKDASLEQSIYDNKLAIEGEALLYLLNIQLEEKVLQPEELEKFIKETIDKIYNELRENKLSEEIKIACEQSGMLIEENQEQNYENYLPEEHIEREQEIFKKIKRDRKNRIKKNKIIKSKNKY